MKTRWATVMMLAAVLVGCNGTPFRLDDPGEAEHDTPHATQVDDAPTAAQANGETASFGYGDWPFVPTQMRVHPFTSLYPHTQTGSTVLEVRMEMLDRLGDVTKGVGEFRFELYRLSPTASGEGERVRLQQWVAPLKTLDQNRRHYDPITRTYIFRLNVTKPLPRDGKLSLTAQFTDPTGRRMIHQSPLTYEPDRNSAPAAGE